ncbi:hypothetical protein [Ferrovibrio sp.]|uniref:hypothetical protein n=1 Tax=Ferrovibrio sp. TaxID=1917215 RepID=UPI003D11B358
MHRYCRLLLVLLAPLATACALEDTVPPAATASAPRAVANSSNEPALPLNPDASAEAKLTQQYANALVNQLNVEREQRRRDLAEMKRRAQTERRLAELNRRKQPLERRQQTAAAVATKPALPQALAIAPAVTLPAQIPAKVQAQIQIPQPAADMPEFESAASIPLPKPLRPARNDGTRNQPEPVLFDPESRKGG